MLSGSQSFERMIALVHWKYAVSTVTTRTHFGTLPLMAKLSVSFGSVEILAQPVMRMVSPTPGMRNNSATRGSRTRLRKAVDAVVAAAVGNDEGVLVEHPHETRRVAARRAVEALGAARRQHHKWRGFDQLAILRRDVIGFLDQRGAVRRVGIKPLELLGRRDRCGLARCHRAVSALAQV